MMSKEIDAEKELRSYINRIKSLIADLRVTRRKLIEEEGKPELLGIAEDITSAIANLAQAMYDLKVASSSIRELEESS